MGKSEGNMLLLSELIDRGYSPLHYRYFCLGAHHRSYLTFSWEALEGAKNAYESLRQKLYELKKSFRVGQASLAARYQDSIMRALADDLNTPLALGELWKMVKDEAVSPARALEVVAKIDQILSLDLLKEPAGVTLEIPEEVKTLAQRRWQLRQQGDFSGADKLREEIKSLGYEIKDAKDNYILTKV